MSILPRRLRLKLRVVLRGSLYSSNSSKSSRAGQQLQLQLSSGVVGCLRAQVEQARGEIQDGDFQVASLNVTSLKQFEAAALKVDVIGLQEVNILEGNTAGYDRKWSKQKGSIVWGDNLPGKKKRVAIASFGHPIRPMRDPWDGAVEM